MPVAVVVAGAVVAVASALKLMVEKDAIWNWVAGLLK
jgi:hypothetical protein